MIESDCKVNRVIEMQWNRQDNSSELCGRIGRNTSKKAQEAKPKKV